MSQWRDIVENILRENDVNLYDIESVNSTGFTFDSLLDQEAENRYIKEQMLKISDEIETYLENIMAEDIKKILKETDNTPKREHDLNIINRTSKLINGFLENFVLNDKDFHKPKQNGQIYFKTNELFPDICLAPKNQKGVAAYDIVNDIVYIFVLNDDGTYNPFELAELIDNYSIKSALDHEFTHKVDKLDRQAAGKTFKTVPNTHNFRYSNNENEINAITNQIIAYIEKDLKQTATDIRNNKTNGLKQYSWKQAISDAINLLLSDLYKQPIGKTLDRMTDDNLKKMYRTIYEYFYKKYFRQYILPNTEQYNQELKNINKDN